MKNRICQLFGIQYPVIQGGMVWCSGWRLASAVSNNGGLGLLGTGSMHPEVLREHIRKTKAATDKPFGVNVPLFYPELETIMDIIISEKVPVVFTSAGSPKKWTPILKEKGIKVAHVIASSAFVVKCEEAGVDAVVAEGFEAGGHNGREETTTLTLIPSVRKVTNLPLIAAGGIATGRGMMAAMALGAEGVQIGSRFAVSEESSAHPDFKKLVTQLGEGDTKLALKKLAPVRLIKNSFFEQVNMAEMAGVSAEDLKILLGKGRAKKGIFEGDLNEGELEIGQVSAFINEILPVKTIMENLIREFQQAKREISESGNFCF
ncbi:MAG: 2-nitropropane dioxygenase [Bacteroidetes bacterium GWF2_42_66]|nr:MAG: 2-nitropropane dioxygenase [Bacteroidetes bacterium GWA2_42_15]OFY01357.1 MAG: 2-nitropropane dioxygenase [Bacteroidetes bacterium GWE2_42_39]OFY42201.1 MAG: 2-nitropropane dioxygenase [Bacteroidetes bacterium GWF2_42_66]HBL77584.1 nitronate monooxygenase [Prolixibacteraceae bacterium]HCB62714.1 nitronate monooxygenase [Bacteroidales bacterium]